MHWTHHVSQDDSGRTIQEITDYAARAYTDSVFAVAYLRRMSKRVLEYTGFWGSVQDLPQQECRSRMSRKYLAAAVHLERQIEAEETVNDIKVQLKP